MTEQHKKLYKTKEWYQIRNYVLLRDKGICHFCGKIIDKRPTVHHLQELNEENWLDWNIALNPDNLVSCHAECHNEHHERFGYKASIVKDDLSIDYSKRKL